MFSDSGRKQTILMILLLFAAAMACYNSALGGGFVWDDEYLIVRNPLIRAPILSFEIFRQDIINSGFTYTIYYRPVQILSYALDYRLWGMNPFGFRLTGIFLHFLNGVLVFLLTMKITEDKAASFLAALLFVVHPAQAGAVSYISSRTDLLFFFFGFLCMMAFVVFVERKKYPFLWLSLFCLALSLLSKEAAVVFPFLLVVLDVLALRGRHRFNALYHVPFFLAAAGYVTLHRFAFSRSYPALLSFGGILRGLAGYADMFREFLALLVMPLEVHMRRATGAPGSLALFIAVAVLFILSAALLKKKRKLLMFSLGFFAVSIAPFIFVVRYFNVYGEHWLYLASYGVFLFIALASTAFYRRYGTPVKVAVTALILVLVAFYSTGTARQSVYWSEGASLSDRVLSFSGGDLPAMHYKAAEHAKRGETAESLEIMKEYAASGGQEARTWYIKGRFTLSAGRADEARLDFEKALSMDPSYSNAYMGLALVSFVKGRDEDAMGYLERAIEADPRNSEALLLLGAASIEKGDAQKGLELTKRASDINPYDYDTLVNLGTAYTRLGGLREAARCYLRATELYPEKPLAYYNLGQVFYSGGQQAEAEKWLERAVEIDPSYEPAIKLLRQIRPDKK